MADNPTIVLIPHSRSHPFTQRECSCLEPLKVGRSVDKKRIFPNNLIFDCRVLSRNHALIWYENGKVRHITDEASIRKPAHERDFKRHSLHPLHSHSIPTHTKHWYALLTPVLHTRHEKQQRNVCERDAPEPFGRGERAGRA